jgi:hypothetical protein
MDGFAIQLALRDPAVTAARVRGHCLALAEGWLRGESTWDGIKR